MISLASNTEETLRSTALNYLLDNITKYPDYDPMDFKDVAFVPALSSDGKPSMGTPHQVYVDPDAIIFGFMVVHPSIRGTATEKLKLKQHPPTSLILPILESSPPREIPEAQKMFEVLAGRVSGNIILCSINSKFLY